MNPFDILGSLIQGGMGPSGGRLERTFGNQGFGGPGGMFGGGPPGMPGQAPGGMPGRGGPGGMPPGWGPGGMPSGGRGGMPGGFPEGMAGGVFDMLRKMMGSVFGGSAPGTGRGGGFPFDILKTIGGMIFGGGGGPAGSGAGPGAAGAGAISILGTLAAQALEYAKQMMAGAGAQGGAGTPQINIDDATAIIAGMRKPTNAQEAQQLHDVATLTVRAMINAAKADCRIDEQEAQRLVGKMQEDGVTDEERNFVMAEMRKPMETDAIVRAVPNQQVATQIYAASLMAIQVDTDAERRYLQELSNKLGLQRPVVAYLHQAVGLA